VRRLLREGIDAHGIDPSSTAIEHCERLAPGRQVEGSILAIPHPTASFETLVCCELLEGLEEDDLPLALKELHRVASRQVFAVVATEPGEVDGRRRLVRSREWWEERFVEAGFRRHPLLLSVVSYAGLEQETGPLTLLFEKPPAGSFEKHSKERLREHGLLHTDHLRATGRRADAHLARYRLAARFVRPGDDVLDVPCGLGYGSAIVAANSAARRVLGIDASTRAVDYARDCYASGSPLLEFRNGNAEDLSFLGDESVDFVAGFETLEHLGEPERFLVEARRVLKPAGRLLASVPNDWPDETGTDPDPHHRHVYTWAKLAEQVGRQFRIEKVFAQTAGGACKLPRAPRALDEIPREKARGVEAEWLLVLAMKDPVRADSSRFRETSFARHDELPGYNITAFGRDYDDPWLVKGMIAIGSRTENEKELRAMAREVLESSRPESADRGAALCVLAYQQLGAAEPDLRAVGETLERLERYDRLAEDSPHAWRWRVSGRFVSGKLLLALGRRDEALRAFECCAELDCLRFSPLLATKTVEALLLAGRIAASDGDSSRARAFWTRAVREAERVTRSDWTNIVGTPEEPVVFGLPEAVQVLDLASRAAYSLQALDTWSQRPGWSWQRSLLSREEALLGHQRLAKSRERGLLAAREALARVEGRCLVLLKEHDEAVDQGRALREELETIRASRSYRLAKRLSSSFALVAPRGSRRARLCRAALAPLRRVRNVLRRQGSWRGVGRRIRTRLEDRARFLRSLLTVRAAARRALRELPPPTPGSKGMVALQLYSFDKGGLEEVVLTLARELRRDGTFDPVILVSEGQPGHLAQVAREEGLPVIALNGNRHLLRRLVGKLRIRLASLHYSPFGTREYERAGVPIVYTVHNTYVWADEDFRLRRAAAYARVARFVAVSGAVARFFAARLQVDRDRIVTIPNGLPADRLPEPEPVTRAELGIGEGDLVFVNVASINWYKYQSLLVAAMARLAESLPGARLLVLGNVHDERCRAHLVREIDRLELMDRVRILEYVPKARLLGILRIADAFVLPSLIEGWSIAVMEAMFSGLPLILSDVGSARDVIDGEDVGIVLSNPFEDIRQVTDELVFGHFTEQASHPGLDELVAAMERIADDREEWRRRGRRGREKVLGEFSARGMGRAYVRLFEELVAARTSS